MMAVKKNYLNKYLFCLIILLGLNIYGQAQEPVMGTLATSVTELAAKSPSNSIYLQTSKGIYETEEDVWFKAWVLDSQLHQLSPLDKTLYVTLAKVANDSVVFKEKYQIENGTTDGHIFISNLWTEGEYWLSAYSEHSFYSNQIPFYATQKIRIISRLGIAKEVVSTKGDNAGTKPLQFNVFPEGGDLVSGLENNLAFKAVDEEGKPIKVSGVLYENGKQIATVTTQYAGMGKINFTPNATKQYNIVLEQQPDITYPLPIIKKQGIQLQLELQNDKELIFKVAQSLNLPTQKIYLRAQIRGMVQFLASGILKDSLRVTFSTKDFPQGITEVTLFDNELKPLAERLVYVNIDKGLKIKVTGLKESYQTREKVTLRLKTTDNENNPISAQLGVSVFDRIYKGSGANNILTYYYLSTQLKGSIYNPNYYFNPINKDRFSALDLLMLTQGWRKYNWDQYSLNQQVSAVTGIVPKENGSLQPIKKNKDNMSQTMVMLFNPKNNNNQMLLLDEKGKFEIDEELFTLGRQFYLKYFPKGNKKYAITLNDPFLGIANTLKQKERLYPINSLIESRKVEEEFTKRKQEQGIINLKEVVIKTAKTDVFRDKYLGHLDTLAKYSVRSDLKHDKDSWMNCDCGRGRRPYEGEMVTVFRDGRQVHHVRFTFLGSEVITYAYHYPKFTEEELLRMNNLIKVQGYYGKRVFYEPNYDKENDPFMDSRNTLLWAPLVMTDGNGEAELTFYASDSNAPFLGVIEGVSGTGLLGAESFEFKVKKKAD